VYVGRRSKGAGNDSTIQAFTPIQKSGEYFNFGVECREVLDLRNQKPRPPQKNAKGWGTLFEEEFSEAV
jgi:hypothetical protein